MVDLLEALHLGGSVRVVVPNGEAELEVSTLVHAWGEVGLGWEERERKMESDCESR